MADFRAIFVSRIEDLLEDMKNEDYSKCPVGKSMPKGVQTLLELRCEELKEKMNGSLLRRIIVRTFLS